MVVLPHPILLGNLGGVTIFSMQYLKSKRDTSSQSLSIEITSEPPLELVENKRVLLVTYAYFSGETLGEITSSLAQKFGTDWAELTVAALFESDTSSTKAKYVGKKKGQVKWLLF